MTTVAALTRTSPRGRRSSPLTRICVAAATGSRVRPASTIPAPADVATYRPRVRSNSRALRRDALRSSLRSKVECVSPSVAQPGRDRRIGPGATRAGLHSCK